MQDLISLGNLSLSFFYLELLWHLVIKVYVSFLMLGIYIFLFSPSADTLLWFSQSPYRVREKEWTIIIVQTKNKTRGGWAETRRMGSLLSELALEKLMENQLKQVAVFSKVSNWLIGRRRYVPKNILTMLRWIVVSPRWSTACAALIDTQRVFLRIIWTAKVESTLRPNQVLCALIEAKFRI